MGRPVHESFDPTGRRVPRGPFAVLAELPDNEPVFYAPSLDYYVVTRHADVESVFLDPETYSAPTAQLPLVKLEPEALKILAEGGSTRSTTAPRSTWSAASPSRCRPRSSSRSWAARPRTGRSSGRGAAHARRSWGRPAPAEQVEDARNMAAYRGYLRALVKSKVDDRADDYASALLAIHDEDPEALSHEEIASILFSLSFAGHETTNYLIGNLIRRLLEERSRWEAVLADRELVPGAVDETLRFDTSVPVWRRITTKPAMLGGVELPEGAKLFLWLAATGHDAEVFPEPGAFDPARENAHRNLAFGKGIHCCAGASLGKLEARLALAGLMDRWPELRLVEDQTIPFHPNISFRGPLELWVSSA